MSTMKIGNRIKKTFAGTALLIYLAIFSECDTGLIEGGWSLAEGPLYTEWSGEIDPENALPEYPRPQMMRQEWLNLNGLWDFTILPDSLEMPETWNDKILVPYPVESALSGVGKKVGSENRAWYRKTFSIPETWNGRNVLLHLGAVDWKATVWINGQKSGSHQGGYDSFTFDISQALVPANEQEIVIAVWDPVDKGTQPRGKQVSEPRGIWYTSVTGIWQTVWLEPVNQEHIHQVKLIPDIDEKQLIVWHSLSIPDRKAILTAELYDDERLVSQAESEGEFIVLPVPDMRLWSPDHPLLYDLKLTLQDGNKEITDEVHSYAGMRKISLGKDNQGITRMMLNNEFLFQFGPLDQGWWPDGLYTAPTDEALKYDVEVTRQLGFNMARKHVKIEPERWYYWCDKLGLLVWQDMPSGDEYIGYNDPDIERSQESDQQYRFELSRMIEDNFNHPSIVMWVPFNEGWGQYATGDIVEYIKDLDPTRLVNPSSGWADRKVGDIQDIHAYPGPSMPDPEQNRAIVLGEFGGLGLPLEGHTWQEKDNWGYRSYENKDELLEAYTALIRKLMPMVRKGLSAAVYTQTTDVEIEVNGLMTYDRKVIKMDPDKLALINTGYLPPVITAESEIFLRSMQVEIKNILQDGDIRYTLDGSDPDEQSALYTGPLLLDGSTTIKACTFWQDEMKSGVSEKTVRKVELRKPVEETPAGKGLNFSYFENQSGTTWTQIPDFEGMEPVSSGVYEQPVLKPAGQDEDFALVFDGLIQVPTAGIYTFYVNSDDGTKLYIDEELVVDNDLEHGMIERSGQMALQDGPFPFRLEFYQGKGGKGLIVSYKGPGFEKQVVPEEAFFH
jgi:hypothetical protein